MRLSVVAAGTRMPGWVDTAWHEYSKRMPAHCRVELQEIALNKHTEKKMLSVLPADALVVALEVNGKQWSTAGLAEQLTRWMESGRDVALLIGGPDGLTDACRERAELQWSLSALTLPHPIVRVVVAEQLYRAWSIISRHPYHRA